MPHCGGVAQGVQKGVEQAIGKGSASKVDVRPGGQPGRVNLALSHRRVCEAARRASGDVNSPTADWIPVSGALTAVRPGGRGR